MNLVWLGAFGLLGVFCRYGCQKTLGPLLPFPAATFLINILGSFLIGLVNGAATRQLASPELAMTITVGLLGGFTTFSAFSWEGLTLLSRGDTIPALLYLLGTPVLGVLAAYAGRLLISA